MFPSESTGVVSSMISIFSLVRSSHRLLTLCGSGNDIREKKGDLHLFATAEDPGIDPQSFADRFRRMQGIIAALSASLDFARIGTPGDDNLDRREAHLCRITVKRGQKP